MRRTLAWLLPWAVVLCACAGTGRPGADEEGWAEDADASSGAEEESWGDDGGAGEDGWDAGREDAGVGEGEGTDSPADGEPAPLYLERVEPASGGASVTTPVRLYGQGFAPGLQVYVGERIAGTVSVLSGTEARADFPPVPLTEIGAKDVRLVRGGEEFTLPGAFAYLFDEDPVVFVHGYLVNSHEWDTMRQRFRDYGYPEGALFAIDFESSLDSHVTHARDELPAYVAGVLQQTGAERVDIVAHSAGGMAARLWISQYGGEQVVRDFVSVSGTHHGTELACIGGWTGDAAREQCPPYASQSESVNLVQWILNGDPDTPDVDETPHGVEDGGTVYYYAFWTEDDRVDIPPHTCCLNQGFRGDCGDPVNTRFSGLGHMEMVTDPKVFELTVQCLRQHNPNRP